MGTETQNVGDTQLLEHPGLVAHCGPKAAQVPGFRVSMAADYHASPSLTICPGSGWLVIDMSGLVNQHSLG